MPTKDPAKRRAINRRYHASPKGRERARELREKNRAKIRAQKRIAKTTRYWKNPDANRKRDYAAWLRRKEAEAGRPKPESCDVCGRRALRIVFDHCHQRGIFRGWLCDDCNIILGHAHDDPAHLLMLVAYLQRTAKLIPPQFTLPGI